MLHSTLSHLRCPNCAAGLELDAFETNRSDSSVRDDVLSGELACKNCPGSFPILGGVAVLVPDVSGYLEAHVKGISAHVAESEIPEAYREAFLEARSELEIEHIEEDLEAERVVALYLMNHYLSARGELPWWASESGSQSPLIASLVREHWDQGPMARITEWLSEEFAARRGAENAPALLELGCGVAGLGARAAKLGARYLGVDSSFASVALGRHLLLGAPWSRPIRVPADLLNGPVSREIAWQPLRAAGCDLIVGDLEALPVAPGEFDVSAALNAIDMLHEPQALPGLQSDLVAPGGLVIQSGPYIWHEEVARELREQLPPALRDSAAAVEWLYEQAGLSIEKRIEHLPWLFFKHPRQLEIYSVHLFQARKPRIKP